jgi:hypothetical protein
MGGQGFKTGNPGLETGNFASRTNRRKRGVFRIVPTVFKG